MTALSVSFPLQRKVSVGQIIGAALALLGLYVIAGWMLGNTVMVQPIAGAVAMRFNTALCFVISGILFALHSADETKISSVAKTIFAAVLLLLPAAVLSEYIFKYDLGIDWASLHRTVEEVNPWPGRMSAITCGAMMMLGAGFLWIQAERRKYRAPTLVIVPVIFIFLLSLISLLESLLSLGNIYRIAQYNLVAVPTAIGLLLASFGLWAVAGFPFAARLFQTAHNDKRITRTAALIMVLLATFSVLLPLAVLKQNTDDSLRLQLQHSSTMTSVHVYDDLKQHLSAAEFLGALPELKQSLTHIHDANAIERLKKVSANFIGHGFSSIRFEDADGISVAALGEVLTNPAATLDIHVETHAARLLWSDGFILEYTQVFEENGHALGRLVTQQKLASLDAFLSGARKLGDTIDTVICGRIGEATRMQCFPGRFIHMALQFDMFENGKARFPMSSALQGESGTRFATDIRGHRFLGAFMPVDKTNLGVVVKIETVELYGTLRRNLDILFFAIVILVIASFYILRLQVQPLATLLVRSEEDMRNANTMLMKDGERLNQMIKAQTQIAQTHLDLDRVLKTVVEQLLLLTGASGTVLELLDGEELLYRAAAGQLKDFVGYRLKAKGSLSGVCIESNEIINCVDTETDPRTDKVATRKFSIHSMIVAPLMNEGKVIGVLKASSGNRNAFGVRETQTISLMSGLISTAIARQQDAEAKQQVLVQREAAIVSLEQAQAKLSYMAQYDQLTGLPNRALFMDRMTVALRRVGRSKKAMALMFLDLDGFKAVNDTLGHAVGDQLLKSFGERLKNVMRGTDTVSRLGGDEFTIIAEELANPDADAVRIAEKITKSMTEPMNILGHALKLTTSIGVYIIKDDAHNVDEAISRADAEMYKAKKAGKNRFSIAAQ